MDVSFSAHKRRIQRGTHVYIMLTLLLGGLIGFYSWDKYMLLTASEELLSRQEEIRSELQKEKIESESLYQAAQEETSGLYEQRQKALKDVFPQNHDLTVLTRTLDKFFLENNYKTQPLMIDTISYGQIKIENEKGYAMLPLTIDGFGSRRNVEKFLLYSEQSGSLASKTRLMKIDKLNLTFETEKETGKEMVQFTAQLVAYFQQPPE